MSTGFSSSGERLSRKVQAWAESRIFIPFSHGSTRLDPQGFNPLFGQPSQGFRSAESKTPPQPENDARPACRVGQPLDILIREPRTTEADEQSAEDTP
jgi:hypothetical protein